MNRYRQLQQLLKTARAQGTRLTCKLTAKQYVLEAEWARINRQPAQNKAIAPTTEPSKSNRSNEAATALKKVEKMFLRATGRRTFKGFQNWLNERIPDRHNQTIEQLRLIWERGTGHQDLVKQYFGSKRRQERYEEAMDALYDLGIELPWS